MTAPDRSGARNADHLRDYLSPELYAQLARDGSLPDAVVRAECERLRVELAAIATYIPSALVREQLARSAPARIRGAYWDGSVLFADLSGFTALSGTLSALGKQGAEEISAIINRLFGALVEEIHRYRGGLLKFGGDAITAFFDAATLGERHALLASRVGLAMHERMAEFAAIETRAGTFPLRLRIGVHSGKVFAAEVGSAEHIELVVTGRNINRVALAQEIAEPGQVVVSGATRALLAEARVESRQSGFALLEGLPDVAPPPPASRWGRALGLGDLAELLSLATQLDALRPYLPRGLPRRFLETFDLGQSGAGGETEAGEFRPVTVLFANFYPFSVALDVLGDDCDAAVAVLNAYYRRAQEVVHRYGGIVNKVDMYTFGDKLMALFGAPVAHEDDPLRAARAALDLHGALDEANHEIFDLLHPKIGRLIKVDRQFLKQRVGINTGVVFAGQVGSARRHEYTVMGQNVNLAARLMSAAEEGVVIVSPATRRAVDRHIAVRELSPVRLKGIAEPVPIAQALRPFEIAQEDRRGVARPDLVGRAREMALLLAEARAALAGGGRVVALAGEAGAGKTRLIEEGLQRLVLLSSQPAGGVVPFFPYDVECQSYEQSTAYAVVRDLLHQLLNLNLADDSAGQFAIVLRRVGELAPELARFAPLLGDLLGASFEDTPLTAALTPQQRHDRTQELFEALLLAEARARPMVLIVDDLHWADASSIELLTRLAGRAPEAPLLLLLGYRLDPPIAEPWRELACCTRIDVRELSPAGSAELVRALLRAEPPPELTALVDKAQGNPFFVEEVVRGLVESGALARDAGGWRLTRELDDAAVPDSIEGVITARLDRLEDRSREVLQVAAVVGRRFPYPVLSGVISRADGLLDRLRLLSEADLIQPEDVERDLAYLFRHALTRDVAYEAILYARRRDLHRRVARRIEELHPDRLDDQLALLARHYLLAEEWEPAFDYHLRAGRYAQARYANREAITLLRQALQIADFRLQNVESQSAIYNLQSAIIELHERLGVIYALIGEYDAALDRYLQALDLLRRQPGAPIDGLVRLHHHIARVYEKRADFDTAFDWVERALALAGDSPSADLTRCVLLGAGLHRRQGRYQQALEWSARALSLAEARGSRRDQAHAMMLLAGTYRNMGDNTRAMELLSRCLPLYEQVQDLLGLADAHNDLANTYYELGRLAEARAHYEAGAEIKQAIGDVYGQAMIANNLGDLLKLQGHVDEAIVQFERSLAIFERLGSLYASGVLHMNLGATYLLRGDDAVAERHLRRAAELYDQAGAEDFLPELERYLAELHLRRGDLPKARLACELALANAARLEARAEEGMARRTLAQVLLRDGDVAGAWDELERSLAILRAAASAHEAARTLLANEVARQIWFILDRAIKSYYPAVENVVLVGGDNVIPFFRVPDETLISNESDYYGQLSSQALGLPPPLPSDAGTPGKPATGLEGSLFYHTIQTDNYYGDRAFTPWRGRGLYLPDLAVGRLVETPEDIDSYLKAYDAYGANFSGYTVNADRAIPGRYGSAYVTGYDFLKDEATAIAGLYGQYGFDPNTTFDKAHALDSSLIGDTWTVDDLTRTWFANQLPQLAGTYGTGSGPQTRYYLMSLNGHFTHYEAIPADLNGGFTAERLYSPTVDAAYPYNAYFKDLYFGGTAPSDTASLVYSVGCHSGLSVINGDLSSDSTYGYKVDFPSAALKQGGNWIGNTGFGYGDSDLIAYSEKLAVQFTRAIGRKVVDANNNYLGPTIGESLARAKRDYVRTAGPGSFGPYDEKVIEEWTLYGLPFIRVKVPSPTPPPYPGGLFDPASVPVPDQTKASLGPNSPTFTRLITVSNIVYSMDTLGGDGVPRVKTAQVQDSFLPGTFTVTGEDLVAAGKPVLPLLTYDITLQDTGKTNGEGSGIPQPRGVRMVGGAMLPELTGFNPHVTTITTDTTFLRQLSDPDLTAQGQWLPEQPFTYQRTSAGGVYADKLLVTPAQFWAASARSGRLRRFSRMVFEVSYIDPRSARLSTLADTTPPRISDVTIVLPPQVKAAIAAAQIKISAKVSDGAGGPLTVKVTYSNDGTTWQTQSLTLNGATGLYEGFITPPPLGTNIFVIVDARDGAGNVATYIAKGALLSYAIVDVPIVRK